MKYLSILFKGLTLVVFIFLLSGCDDKLEVLEINEFSVEPYIDVQVSNAAKAKLISLQVVMLV